MAPSVLFREKVPLRKFSCNHWSVGRALKFYSVRRECSGLVKILSLLMGRSTFEIGRMFNQDSSRGGAERRHVHGSPESVAGHGERRVLEFSNSNSESVNLNEQWSVLASRLIAGRAERGGAFQLMRVSKEIRTGKFTRGCGAGE
jgi:hypothetical protein